MMEYSADSEPDFFEEAQDELDDHWEDCGVTIYEEWDSDPQEYFDEADNQLDDDCEDWGFTFDDKCGAYWEQYYAGPDDKNNDEDDIYNYDSDYYFDNPSNRDLNVKRRRHEDSTDCQFNHNSQSDHEGENSMIRSRQEEIIDWLSSSGARRHFRNGSSFFVSSATQVRFWDGTERNLLEWLRDEGIGAGQHISGFKILYERPCEKYGERLVFLEQIQEVVEAPFVKCSADSGAQETIDQKTRAAEAEIKESADMGNDEIPF